MATYNPAVNDRSGEIRAAGLADAFRTFGSYGMQGMQWGRDNRQRAEDMAFKREMFSADQAAQERQFAMANARDQQRFAMEMQSHQMAQAERKAMAEERKASSMAEADGLTAAVMQSFGSRISEDERARVAAMPPQARKAWALTQSKLIPQIAEEERNRSPMEFTSPPGAPNMGIVRQAGQFKGMYTIPQPEPARIPPPDIEGVDPVTGEMVRGWFEPGADGSLGVKTIKIPGVKASATQPVNPRFFDGGADGNGVPILTGVLPVPGGIRVERLEPGKTYPIGGAQSPSPAPATPPSSLPYYKR